MKRVSLVVAGLFVAISFSLASPSALASYRYIRIPDTGALKYQLGSDGRVWFRNLNEFDGGVSGCCYTFFLDTTTSYGKSAWALILSKVATGGGLWFFVTNPNPTEASPTEVGQVGDW